MHDEALSWCEVDTGALEHNVRELRRIAPPPTILAPVVKGNAYGHGLDIAARAFVAGGADWLCVHEVPEATRLRRLGIDVPIYVMGPLLPSQAPALAAAGGVRTVVYSADTLDALAAAARAVGTSLPVHVKIETGNQRQGLPPRDALALAERVVRTPGVHLEGFATHFADIEDTTDHTFARRQLRIFDECLAAAHGRGIEAPIVHCTNSAATILWPHTHRGMVRVGIAAYGMWPSKETFITALLARRHDVHLRPALTWKARIAQVRDVEAGAYVGYGRSYRTTHDARLAVVAVGYYDGYDRRLSNQAHVLVDGHRAPVRGRVCMNLVMVDVTHVPGVRAGAVAILLGGDDRDRITAEQIAAWIGTINYEVTTRIRDTLPRIAVRRGAR